MSIYVFFLLSTRRCFLDLLLSSFFIYSPFFFPPSCATFEPADVLHRERSPHEDDGEDEEESRVQEEQTRFTAASAASAAEDDEDEDGDDDDAVDASSSALVTNPLPPEALPAACSSQEPPELTNPDSELTSLGKLSSGCCPAAASRLRGFLCFSCSFTFLDAPHPKCLLIIYSADSLFYG